MNESSVVKRTLKKQSSLTVIPIHTRRHAPLLTTHRIGGEENKQTTETMDPNSETMEQRDNKNK